MMRGRYSGSDMLRVVPEIRVDEVLIDQRRFRFAYHTPRHRSTPIGESIPTETKRQRQRQRQTERQRDREFLYSYQPAVSGNAPGISPSLAFTERIAPAARSRVAMAILPLFTRF